MSCTPETEKLNGRLDYSLTDAYLLMTQHARKLERECNELRKALSLAGKLCHEVHHPKSMQHGDLDPCPVEALIHNGNTSRSWRC